MWWDEIKLIAFELELVCEHTTRYNLSNDIIVGIFLSFVFSQPDIYIKTISRLLLKHSSEAKTNKSIQYIIINKNKNKNKSEDWLNKKQSLKNLGI